MYAFLLFGLPLAYVLLILRVYPREDAQATRRATVRGLLAAIPVWLLARLLGNLVPAAWGSPLLAFHEWADRFLPYAVLPALAYAVFYHYGESLPAGQAARRLTAFYAGALSPLGLGEMTRIWGNPSAYSVLVLPLLFTALALAMPALVLAFFEEYGARRALPVLAAVLATLAASLVQWLFLARFWPLALLLAAGLAAAAWLYAAPGLLRRPPRPAA